MNEGQMAIFFMFFATPVIVVSLVFGFIYHMNKMKLQAKATNSQGEKFAGEVNARLEKIERRLANLETIVLESEKKREFERL